MTTSGSGSRFGHVGARAGFLAALPLDDPERRMARAHASWCTTCRDALAEGERLMALLAVVLSDPQPAFGSLAGLAAGRVDWREPGQRRGHGRGHDRSRDRGRDRGHNYDSDDGGHADREARICSAPRPARGPGRRRLHPLGAGRGRWVSAWVSSSGQRSRRHDW